MHFKKNNIDKAVSALLLVMLLLIHSIKLLHSHSYDKFCKDSNSATVKSAVDCSICTYQVNKDADDHIYLSICENEIEPLLFNSSLISFHKPSFHTAFENRGPPAI